MTDQVDVKKSFDIRHLTSGEQIDDEQPQKVESVSEPAANAQLRFSIAHIMGFMGKKVIQMFVNQL